MLKNAFSLLAGSLFLMLRVTPGGSDEKLAAGSSITDTESSMDLESLRGKFVFGGV